MREKPRSTVPRGVTKLPTSSSSRGERELRALGSVMGVGVRGVLAVPTAYRPRSVQVGLGRDSELDYPRGISPLRDLLRAD